MNSLLGPPSSPLVSLPLDGRAVPSCGTISRIETSPGTLNNSPIFLPLISRGTGPYFRSTATCAFVFPACTRDSRFLSHASFRDILAAANVAQRPFYDAGLSDPLLRSTQRTFRKTHFYNFFTSHHGNFSLDSIINISLN